MKNNQQKSYAELLNELQGILQAIEKGESNPDQWQSQLAEVQQLIAECRQRLQGAETAIENTLTQH